MSSRLNSDLIAQSLCFHGQPLLKIWEGERGNDELFKLGLSNPDYSVYMQRQRVLTFQDRAKRLKLHQFLARKAEDLFDSGLVNKTFPANGASGEGTKPPGVIAPVPPFEVFVNKSVDKSKHLHLFLGSIKPGDIVYGTVLNRSTNGLLIKVLCTGEPLVRYLSDITIKAFVLPQNYIPIFDKKGNPRQWSTNDYVCCEVLDISVDADRMTLGMKGVLTTNAKAPLGWITDSQLPEYYKRVSQNPNLSFEHLLESAKSFENPNSIDALYEEVGLDIAETYSNMKSLKNRFPSSDYASELRQTQASKWAFRSVADGIEHFKVGRHVEAFQSLNKALNIDPRNVEGLVARGALYANSNSLKKAVEDFETALKINFYHSNARKYLSETLVALGRSYEEENKIDEARKAYQNCLNIMPNHEEAKSSLDALNNLQHSKHILEGSGLVHPSGMNSHAISLKKSDKKKKKHRNRRSSSSSSSDSDSSSESDSSSSDSDESDSADDRDDGKNRKRNRQTSLSPFSKRMAQMDPSSIAAAVGGVTNTGVGPPGNNMLGGFYQFNQAFHMMGMAGGGVMPPALGPPGVPTGQDYDSQVRNFLEVSREEDDYESRVRKLISEASKHRKEREGKSKKKEKKKRKKAKKDKKKIGGGLEIDGIDSMKLEEALKILKSVPITAAEVESKLTADLQKYERSIEDIQKRREVPGTSRMHTTDSPERRSRARESTPPPPPPPMTGASHKIDLQHTSKLGLGGSNISYPAAEDKSKAAPFKPFPIKAPVVLDKFGCFRLAAPPVEAQNALNERSRSRSRSRSRHRRRRSYSRSRSRSRRRSRSRSRGNYRRRSRSRGRRSRSRGRRRSPSPFVPRGTFSRRRRIPSPFVPRGSPDRRRRSRSRSMDRGGNRGRFNSRGRGRGGRVRAGSRFRDGSRSPVPRNSSSARNSRPRKGINDVWLHDKFKKVTDDPTIEEIDEIIKKAQNERKEEIIQRDKDLLKKKD